jgi:hypothetical protein
MCHTNMVIIIDILHMFEKSVKENKYSYKPKRDKNELIINGCM